MINSSFEKINLTKIFLILSFIFCWGSISTDANDIAKIFQIYKFNKYEAVTDVGKLIPTLNQIINSLRQLLIFIIFPILLILNLSKFENKNLKENLPFFCLFLYFLLQIPGLLFTENTYLNLSYVISSLNILLIFNLTDQFFNKKTYKIFIYINLFFLILITFLNREALISFWNSDIGNVLYLFRDANSDIFFGKSAPRATGSARVILLIYIISIFIFKDFFKNHKVLKNTFYLITAVIILLYQSRTVIVMGAVFLFINYFDEKNKNIFRYLIFHIIVPIIALYLIIFIKNYEQIRISGGILNYSNSIQSIEKNFVRPIDPDSFSSGRAEDWHNLISKYKKDFKYFGYGAQADRFLINQSASNGIIYAFTSSGVIGIFFYSIFVLSCLVKIFNNLVLKLKRCSSEHRLNSIVILLILARSVLETSFSVFSVDLIIICTFYTYLSKKNYR